MVQTADLWEGDKGACGGWLYGPRLGAILVQREMRPAPVVITKVRRQHTAQVTLIEDDDVIETFAADRADDALDVGILPWRSRCSDDLLDRHRLNTIAEDLVGPKNWTGRRRKVKKLERLSSPAFRRHQ